MAVEIVGRDEEVASLHAFFDGARQGLRAAVLEGEPGIGKTTIWLAGLDAARERSFRVLAARPAEAEQGLAHAALTDLLEPYVEDVLPALPAPRRRALEAVLLLEGGDGTTTDPRALGVAVHGTLRALAQAGPVLIAIDDLQWLDSSSSAALTFALRRLDGEPVALLLARRAGDAPSPVELALPDARVQRLSVGPVSLGAAQRLVRERLGRTFPRPTFLRIHDVSGGNPFFALELARALADVSAPVDPAAPLPVPEALDRLVGDRLRALPRETREALLVVAVVGSPTTRLLEDVRIEIETLEPALAAQVAEVENGEVRFTHPLLASQVVAEASEEERRGAHRLVAAVVDDPVSRARHVAAALERPDEATAAVLEETAGVARARGAASVAAELGEAAMRATPPEAADDRRRRGLRAARDHFAGGSSDLAYVLARGLLDDAEPGGARAEALVLLADLEAQAGTLDQAVGCLERALEEAAGLPGLEVAIHQRLAQLTRISVGLEVAEGHARAALRLGEQLDSDSLTAQTLAALAIVRFNASEPDSFGLAERALRLAERSGDKAAIVEATAARVHCLIWSGRLEEAHPILIARIPQSAELDEPDTVGPLFYMTLLEQRAGRLSSAREYAERQRDVVTQYGGPELEDAPTVAGMVAQVALWQGEVELARELAERALAHPDGRAPFSFSRFQIALLGQIDAWSGDAARAVERFAAVERSRKAAGFAYATAGHLADHVEVLLELGRPAEAASLLDAWEADARTLGHAWALPQTVRCRGLVAAAAGEVDTAIDLLERAVDESGGDPLGCGRALLALGVTRRRARQKRAAREALEEALAVFQDAGAAGWAEKARAELGSIGGRTRADELTPAERRVAVLVAEGRTNREVAAALVLGERTVESHLTRVYAKLGVRSRTELARRIG